MILKDDQLMRLFGIILLVAGIIMMAVTGFNFTTKKKVLDAGPIEITRDENHWVEWPVWAGGIAVVAGIVLMVAARKNTE